MGRLELQNLSISYRQKTVIRNINLTVRDGELLSLLGPSGAGKTTLLKTIAGLHQSTEGRILINGQEVSGLAAEKRNVVLIFQNPLLFPFLNVSENIGFGLKMKGAGKAVARKKIAEMVKITGLEGLETRKIHQLSGGQQQRVALARGLVLDPSVLLLDEPLSNLDPELRQKMRNEIRQIQQQTGTTMLFVTHDQGEAFSISDRIALLIDSNIVQTGTPEELFYKPVSSEVARFFGNTNILKGKVENEVFSCESLRFAVFSEDAAAVTAIFRPEDLVLSTTQCSDSLRVTIKKKEFHGSLTRYTLDCGTLFLTVLSNRSGYQKGEVVWVSVSAEKIHII
jgi:ABC-type sugar transport system ATPase subunit